MANKRQRKKQQTKKTISLFNSLGKDKSFIKENKNNQKVAKKLQQQKRKNDIAKERSDFMRNVLGLKMTGEDRKKRYWGEKRWNEWKDNELKKIKAKKRREEKKQRDNNDLYLIMLWRDKTAEGFADTELIKRYKFQYAHMDNEALLELIKHYYTTNKPQGAEIGTTITRVVKGHQKQEYINFMTNISGVSNKQSDSNDWILVYEGKAKRYHDVLVAIHAIVRLLYDASERYDFILNILDKWLPQINKNMARRLAKDLNWRSF